MQFFLKAKENYLLSISDSNVTDFWTNYICRRLASFIVIIIHTTFISPNMVTIFSSLLCIMGNYYLLTNNLTISASLFFFSFVMDCVDGQLARKRNSISKLGIYLDIIFDSLKELITFSIFILYFSDTIFFISSLLAMLIVSFSFVLDWARKLLINEIKESKSKDLGILGKYGIVFWSGPIRNFIIVFSLCFKTPEIIIFYCCSFGTYFTIKKGLKIIDTIKIV